MEGDRGGRRPGEKGAGGVREAGEKGAGRGIAKVTGSGRKGKNYATLHNIVQSKIAKRQEPGNKGYGQGKSDLFLHS